MITDDPKSRVNRQSRHPEVLRRISSIRAETKRSFGVPQDDGSAGTRCVGEKRMIQVRIAAMLLSALLIAGPAFSAPATRPATQAVAVDLSTPRSAGKAYADAVLGPTADPKRLREVVIGDER